MLKAECVKICMKGSTGIMGLHSARTQFHREIVDAYINGSQLKIYNVCNHLQANADSGLYHRHGKNVLQFLVLI